MSYLTKWCIMQQDDRQERQISQGLWRTLQPGDVLLGDIEYIRERNLGNGQIEVQGLRVPYETYRKFYPGAPERS